MTKKKTMEQLLENTRKALEDSPDPNSETAKVLIPVLRNVIPSIIAEEILGVQPMTSRCMQVGEMDHACSKWYWVSPDHNLSIPWEDMVARNQAINNWCDDTYGPKGDWADADCRWYASNRKYIFKNKEDRTMFVLRWS